MHSIKQVNATFNQTHNVQTGSNVEEIVHNNVHFMVWDLGGQDSLRSAWATYYVNTNVRSFLKWMMNGE